MARSVAAMPVREKREVYGLMRQAPVHTNTYMPKFGITVGEFAALEVLRSSATT